MCAPPHMKEAAWSGLLRDVERSSPEVEVEITGALWHWSGRAALSALPDVTSDPSYTAT